MPQKATLADHKLTKGAGAFASDSSACTATKELVDFHARGKAPFSWALMRSEITMGAKYIGSGENRSSAVHLEDLAELYCQALKNAQSSCVIHAAGENVSTKEVALSIHRAMKFKGDPKSISLEEARRQTPIADGLTRSHALSADYAKSTFGWTASRGSILRAIEDYAVLYARARSRKVSAIPE